MPDDLKAIFIEYVHRHLARFGCEVSRDRRYLCRECGTPVKDLDAVRKRLEAKKDFITCQTCDERVMLIDFIEQQLESDPVARRDPGNGCNWRRARSIHRRWNRS